MGNIRFERRSTSNWRTETVDLDGTVTKTSERKSDEISVDMDANTIDPRRRFGSIAVVSWLVSTFRQLWHKVLLLWPF